MHLEDRLRHHLLKETLEMSASNRNGKTRYIPRSLHPHRPSFLQERNGGGQKWEELLRRV